jgi:PPP family 3-phenylpropionic acid transporter
MGLIAPYLAVYLDGKGFSSLHIGEIIAIVTASKIIGPSLWATLADKTGKHVYFIKIGSVLAIFSFITVFWLDSYWELTFALTLFSLFWTAILPQIEVLTLHSVRLKAHIYGRIRVWGSIGFIIFSMLAGYGIDEFGSEAFPYLVLIALLGLLFSHSLLQQPRVPGQIKNNGAKVSSAGRELSLSKPIESNATVIFSKILSPAFIIFFIAGLLLQISFGAYYNFFVLLLLDHNYSGLFIGVLLGIAVLAEIFIFIFSGKLFKYFSLKILLILSLLFSALRWLLIAHFVDSLFLLIFSQLIHALSFGVYHSASVLFISQHFDSNQQNRGQAIYVGGIYGLGAAIGAYVAGSMWQEGAGAIMTFEVSAGVAFIGAVLLLLLKEKKKI